MNKYSDEMIKFKQALLELKIALIYFEKEYKIKGIVIIFLLSITISLFVKNNQLNHELEKLYEVVCAEK